MDDIKKIFQNIPFEKIHSSMNMIHFLNSAGGVIAIVSAAIIGLMKAFSMADIVLQRVRERKVKRLFQALRMQQSLMKETGNSEESIYKEALQQELFSLTLGLRATKLTREIILQYINAGSSLYRLLEALKISGLEQKKNGTYFIPQAPFAVLAFLGVILCLFSLPYTLFPILIDGWEKVLGVYGPLLRIGYALFTGASIGIVARITIKPLFFVRQINKVLLTI